MKRKIALGLLLILVAWLPYVASLMAGGVVSGGITADTTVWTNGTGSPTFASASTFTVTNDATRAAEYYPGRLLRYRDTAGGSTFQNTMISAYSAGTVTVTDAGLDSGLTNVEVANVEPITILFSVTGRLPGAATNNLSGRVRVNRTCEPVGVSFYVEVLASTNGATSGNTSVRLNSGTDPTANGATNVLAATNLAWNASESLNNNPTHTELVMGSYLQVDVTTTGPVGGAADNLFLILPCMPKNAKEAADA